MGFLPASRPVSVVHDPWLCHQRDADVPSCAPVTVSCDLASVGNSGLWEPKSPIYSEHFSLGALAETMTVCILSMIEDTWFGTTRPMRGREGIADGMSDHSPGFRLLLSIVSFRPQSLE